MEYEGDKGSREGGGSFSVLSDSVQLRAMAPSDIEQIMIIERASSPSPWSSHFFLEEVRVPHSKSVLAEIDGRIVGYIVFWQLPADLDIHNLAVHPEFQRRGIGGHLLGKAIAHAKKYRLNRITLEVRQSNLVAQRLYGSFGFIAEGFRRAYYSNDGEDAILMGLELERQSTD